MDIDYKKLADELGKVLGSKQQEHEEQHVEQHRVLGQMLPYAPLLIEIAEEMKERREMRKHLMEKIIGALLLGSILAACGWAGNGAIGFLSSKIGFSQTQGRK